jgi:hypothetical protein
MITEVLGRVGKTMIGLPDVNVAQQSDPIKLRDRVDTELNLAAGCAGLFLLGFLLVIGLGILTDTIWRNPRLGAGVGACVAIMGIFGSLLHYMRSRVLSRRAARLERGESLQNPLHATFWTSSSDLDLLFQLAIGLIALVITFAS